MYSEAEMIAAVPYIAIFIGAIIGAVPAIYGGMKGKLPLGILGFVVCTICPILIGILLTIPVGALFVWLIFKQVKNQDDNTNN